MLNFTIYFNLLGSKVKLKKSSDFVKKKCYIKNNRSDILGKNAEPDTLLKNQRLLIHGIDKKNNNREGNKERERERK